MVVITQDSFFHLNLYVRIPQKHDVRMSKMWNVTFEGGNGRYFSKPSNINIISKMLFNTHISTYNCYPSISTEAYICNIWFKRGITDSKPWETSNISVTTVHQLRYIEIAGEMRPHNDCLSYSTWNAGMHQPYIYIC